MIKYERKTNLKNQYSEANVMHFLVGLLRINGLYTFRALLSHPQETLHKWHLVYCVRVTSVGCYQGWSGTGVGDVHHVCFTILICYDAGQQNINL
jgi:hypothetical protein